MRTYLKKSKSENIRRIIMSDLEMIKKKIFGEKIQSYSLVRLRLNGRVTRFTFSAAISKSLELK